MPRSLSRLGPLTAGLLAAALLTGCASSRAATPRVRAAAATPAAATAATSADMPTPAALMVCGDDIRGKVGQVLGLTGPPSTTHTFLDARFTCTYQLPVGPLVLAVQQSPTPSAASRYFAGQRLALHGDNLPGLGQDAFGTPTGTVVVIKDSQTLTVDATHLPAVFGSQHQHRTDLAYEIASDVLGCWTGD